MNHSLVQSPVACRPVAGAKAGSLMVSAGDLVAGKYLVGEVIAHGGMGIIVSAIHRDLRAQVAMKIVRSDLASDQGLVERLLNEARAAASLKSEHVARVIDCGKLESGAPFLVMEHLEGMDLRTVLERRGPLPITEAVDYVAQVCEGLAEAHAAGIVHRDIKPENLFLTTNVSGRPVIKILDFGISKRITSDLGSRKLTMPGMSIGSPWYMSPEQTRASNQVDERTDLWSLGVVLYEILTGKRPFEGETVAVVSAQVLAREPPSARALRPEIPAGLDAIIMRCLDKSPGERFQGIGALALALKPYAGTHQLNAAAIPEPQPVTASAIRRTPASVVVHELEVHEFELESVPSSDYLQQGMAATRNSSRVTAGSIPGLRSRRPVFISMAAALFAAGTFATAHHRGYELGHPPLDRRTLAAGWSSVASGATQLWNHLELMTEATPPPPLPAAVLGQVAAPPAVELPPDMLLERTADTERKQRQKAARLGDVPDRLRMPVQRTVNSHSGAIAYE